MRRFRNILRLLSGTAALLAAVACPNNEMDIYIGQQVNFSASTGYMSSRPGTRTSYSGLIFNGYERIDWETGDPIQIYSAQARHANTGSNFADYAVKSATGSSSASNADIYPVGGNGLTWGTGQHDFYTVYPAPSKNASVSIEKSGDDILVHGTVPAEQAVTWAISGTTAIAKPDMDYAYMYAAVKNASPSSTVNLYFKPMVTAFQITVTSADDNELTLKSFRMVSDGNDSDTETPWCALSGDFTATITDATTAENLATDAATFACPARDKDGDDANNVITVDLKNQKIYKNASDGPTSAYFTVFALPQNLSHVRLELIVMTAEGTELTRKIALKRNVTPGSDDSDVITFPACHKAYINNLGIPGTWTYHMNPVADIVIGGYTAYTSEDVIYDAVREVEIKTYKSATGMDDKDVTWKMYFTTENPAGKKHISEFAAATPCRTEPYKRNEASEYETTESYITPSTTTGDGAQNPVSFNILATSLPPKVPSDVSMNTGVIQRHYADRTADGLDIPTDQITRLKGHMLPDGLDLSTYDFISQTAGHPSETANCYVIDGYGENLRIPLVYGNAIRNGEDNPSAYSTGRNYSDYLNTFLNADKLPIRSASILDDTFNPALSGEYEARIVWQDVRNGYEIIRPGTATIDPVGKYLVFSIKQEDIKPGNIVIALYDKGKGEILWSWHLWVYGEELFTRTVTRGDYSTTFLSANLGWTAPLQYAPKSTKLTQQYAVVTVNDGTENDGKVLGYFMIKQKVFTTPGTENNFYSGTFYQWGCKNPYLPFNNHDGYKNGKFNTTECEEYIMNTYDPLNRAVCTRTEHSIYHDSRYNQLGTANGAGNGRTTIQNSIVSPHLYNVNPVTFANAWNVPFLRNHVTQQDRRVPTVKSIYDPCPRGFCVPRRDDFLALIDPARNTEDTQSNANKIAKGYGNPNESGTHEIFGKLIQGSAPQYGGIRFYTDDGNNDLEFRWTGYRGMNSDGQPNYGGFLQTSDVWFSDATLHGDSSDRSMFHFDPKYYPNGTHTPGFVPDHAATLYYSRGSVWGLPVRPVQDVLSSAIFSHGSGASTSGQTVEDHNAGGLSWE